MDYSRNYFSVSALTVFILTALCSGAPQLNSQDVSKETEVFDKTNPLMTSVSAQGVASSSSSTTSEGDIIITASAEAVVEGQSLFSEDTPVVPPNTLPEGQVPESSSLSTSDSKTQSTLTPSETHDDSTVTNTETKPNDESKPTTKSSTKKPSTSSSGEEKPESSSSSHKHNGASTVVPLNIAGLFLIAFVSRALFLKA